MSNPRFCDMHVHSEYSHDCDTPLLTIKRFCEANGMMVAITDHNEIAGNLAAASIGIPVIPAIEVTTRNLKDFLVYFYTQDDLVEFYETIVLPAKNPGRIWGSRTTLSEERLLRATKQYDCVVSLAHPYCPFPKRSAKLPNHLLRQLDAVEVMNFAMSPRANQRAAALCDATAKVHTAGSDSHHPSTLGMVATRGHGETPAEFLRTVAQGSTMVVGFGRTNMDVVAKVRQFMAYKMAQ